jgi:hypothetical protein
MTMQDLERVASARVTLKAKKRPNRDTWQKDNIYEKGGLNLEVMKV